MYRLTEIIDINDDNDYVMVLSLKFRRKIASVPYGLCLWTCPRRERGNAFAFKRSGPGELPPQEQAISS